MTYRIVEKYDAHILAFLFYLGAGYAHLAEVFSVIHCTGIIECEGFIPYKYRGQADINAQIFA